MMSGHKHNFYQLVSVDIWDTVLRRKCHPDEVKIRVSYYLLNKYGNLIQPYYKTIEALTIERYKAEGYLAQAAKSSGFDDEYKLREVHYYWLGTVCAKIFDSEELELVLDDLTSIEISSEIDALYLDNKIIPLIHKYQYSNIVFISDFYMSKNIIETFLDKAGCDIKFDGVYVSCDYLKNKRSGKLFQQVHNDFNVLPETHLHIGDNIISDVKTPNKLGIHTIHYQNKTEEIQRQQNQQKFNLRFQDIKPHINELRNSLNTEIIPNAGLTKKQIRLFNIGKKYSVLFYSFVLYIIEQSLAESHPIVYYFTREGEFFKKIHDSIAQNNTLMVEIPKTELLEVSRIATFSPSIKEVSLQEFMRIWNMYSTQSMKALFTSLDIDINNYEKFWQIYEIDIDEKIQYPWLDKRIIALFSDSDFVSRLNNDISHKRETIFKYLMSKGICFNQDKLAIVDIGWRGTIQDNLASILNQTEITGYYFGLQSFLNQQPNNSKKQSYGPNANLNEDYTHCIKFVSPFEMICNSPNGSVKGYKLEESNSNNIVPIRKNDAIEDFVYQEYTYYIQQGILSSIDLISEKVKIHSFSSLDLKSYAYELLEKLSTNPERLLAESYFILNHDETFGLGSFIDKKSGKFFPKKLFLKALLFKKYRSQFWDYIESSGWPQGFLNYYYMNSLLQRYNFINRFKN